jgi:putative transposase
MRTGGAALDRHTYEVIHVEASPGRSELDALLFLRTVLERCQGRPVVIVDRGPWYNWSLDDLPRDYVRIYIPREI